MKRFIFIILICFAALNSTAQTDSGRSAGVADTARPVKRPVVAKPVKRRIVADTTRRNILADSTNRGFSARTDSAIPGISGSAPLADTARAVKPARIKKPIDSFYLKLLDNPFFRTTEKPIYLVINERRRQAKDEIFYLLAGLLLFLAFIKLVFSKYFNNLFRLFIQPTFRQKQTREQLQQNNLPSFLLNLFFVFSAGAYVSFIIQYYQLIDVNFWLILFYSVGSLLVLYTGKFIFLSFAGWVFNVKEATDSYIFAVYLINKILGVTLIPFTLILAFSPTEVINISVTVSLLFVFLLFVYRFIMSYAPVRREIRVSLLHFLFYIFAFEVVPLLLIYKTLIIFLNKSA